MPFLRFSRDKRGYEHFYLIEPTTRRGKSRNRILYWFRTPPGIKVGRLPFDDHMRQVLEARYPDVTFDWQKLIDTPIPPPAPDVERWRERRRLERAAKQAAASEAAAGSGDPSSEEGEPPDSVSTLPSLVAPEGVAVGGAVGDPPNAPTAQPARRRRRRSGRRGRTGGGSPAGPAGEGADAARSPDNASPSNAADSPDRDED